MFTVPPAVALLNFISSGILWRIFCQTGIFAGFSLIIIYVVRSISAAAIAGNIILFSLGGLVGDYSGAYIVIFRGIFFHICIISQKEQRSCNGRSGGGGRDGGHYFFRCRTA
jgi:cobalamin synthase